MAAYCFLCLRASARAAAPLLLLVKQAVAAEQVCAAAFREAASPDDRWRRHRYQLAVSITSKLPRARLLCAYNRESKSSLSSVQALRPAQMNSSTERWSDSDVQNGSQTTPGRSGKTRQEASRFQSLRASLLARRRLLASPEPSEQPYGQPASPALRQRDRARPSAAQRRGEPKRSNLNAARTPPPQQKKCGS